jgi:hypothetical protein
VVVFIFRDPRLLFYMPLVLFTFNVIIWFLDFYTCCCLPSWMLRDWAFSFSFPLEGKWSTSYRAVICFRVVPVPGFSVDYNIISPVSAYYLLKNKNACEITLRLAAWKWVEYLHCIHASYRRRRNGNRVPGGITGSLCSWGGYKHGELAFQVGGVSNLRE